jgi:5-methylcytosine-specific restriction endonuclease McrA
VTRLPLLLALALPLFPAARTYSDRTPRSASAKAAFKRSQRCPSTGKAQGACPGYVIDHIVPLACGGQDAPFNMQWQTVKQGREKDKWERKGCK